MKTIPYPTYEDAAREYVGKFNALMQPMQEPAGNAARGVVDLPAEVLFERAEEIADLSAGLFQLAQQHLASGDPDVREGIRYHLTVQAVAELLFVIDLLQISEENNAVLSTAATKATHGAALREAISAVEKSLFVPVGQGLPTDASYRAASESATISEAALGLKLAVDSTATNIVHKVQELGGDMAFELVTGTQWTDLTRGASLGVEEIRTILESVHKGAAGRLVPAVYEKVAALLNTEMAAEARLKILGWLDKMKEADRIDLFNALVYKFYGVEALKKSVSAVERSAAQLDSINRCSDLIRAFSDKFTFLVDRMRKLEDAIRLGSQVESPQFRLVTIALQVALLSALVYAGKDYVHQDLAGILNRLKIED